MYGLFMDAKTETRLRQLNDDIWEKLSDSDGRYACRKLTPEEKSIVVDSIWRYDLPCVLGSGPLGDLSVTVFGHSPFPEVRPDSLIKIHQNHLDLPSGIVHWNERFDWFSQFTHRPRNLELATFYGLPSPGPRESYEY